MTSPSVPSSRAVRLARAALFTLHLRERAPEALQILRHAVRDYRFSPYVTGRAFPLVAGVERAIRYLTSGQHGSPTTEQAADLLAPPPAA